MKLQLQNRSSLDRGISRCITERVAFSVEFLPCGCSILLLPYGSQPLIDSMKGIIVVTESSPHIHSPNVAPARQSPSGRGTPLRDRNWSKYHG